VYWFHETRRKNIMNFFKKALVASAVVASFGAAADATVSSTALELSQEGIAAGNTAGTQALSFDVVVGTDTPSSSVITLTFDSTVDLGALTGGAVTNAPGTGTGEIITDAATGDQVIFDYGTGSFTFDNVVVTDNDNTTGAKDSISFKVNLGNSLTAGSAFRVTLGDTVTPVGLATISGAANLAYQSTNAAGDVVIENGTGAVAKEVTQFGIAVNTPYDKLINRDDLTKFNDATVADSLVLTYTNQGDLAAALTNTDVVHVIKGNFANLVTADFLTTTVAVAPATVATALTADDASAVVSGTAGAEDTLTVTLAAANTALDGSTTITVDFASTIATTVIPSTGELEATITANNTDDSSAAVVTTLATNASAGEWAIDATIINVPYFPVGYDGVQSTIQLANEGNSLVDVIVTANDKMGNKYGPVNLNTLAAYAAGLPAHAVSKVSDVDVMTLLGAPAESSLSITFNVDANEGVVNGYAYTQKAGTGRTEVSTSQQRGN
jgi:hypothetical protein